MKQYLMHTLFPHKSMSDQKSMMFIDYVMKKYFISQKEWMLLSDAVPYLEPGDKEELEEIIDKAFYKAS